MMCTPFTDRICMCISNRLDEGEHNPALLNVAQLEEPSRWAHRGDRDENSSGSTASEMEPAS